MKTAIIGAGTWGTALSRAIALKTEEVTVWTCIPEEAERLTRERAHWNLPGMTVPGNVSFTTDGEEAVRGAEFIIVAVPSVYVRQTMSTFREQIQGNPVIICASKGIESSTLLTLTGVIRDELRPEESKASRIAAISGPTHAEEVARDMPTLLVAASENLETAAKVQQLFENTCIRAYTNTDLLGVEICGALKNVEALAVGIAAGLGYGDNTRAALITRGMEEIRRLGLAMGCAERTFFGLAGIGDLIVTATSMHSRNNRAGILIGKGKGVREAVKEVGMVVEGINALPAATALCRKYGMDMPLIQAVHEIVENDAKPDEIVRDLMNRKLRME